MTHKHRNKLAHELADRSGEKIKEKIIREEIETLIHSLMLENGVPVGAHAYYSIDFHFRIGDPSIPGAEGTSAAKVNILNGTVHE